MHDPCDSLTVICSEERQNSQERCYNKGFLASYMEDAQEVKRPHVQKFVIFQSG